MFIHINIAYGHCSAVIGRKESRNDECGTLSRGVVGGGHGTRLLHCPGAGSTAAAMASCHTSKSPTREVKNEVQDSRSRSDGVHCGSIGHHCNGGCSPQGCCWPSAFHACARRRSSFQLAVLLPMPLPLRPVAPERPEAVRGEPAQSKTGTGPRTASGAAWNRWRRFNCNWNWWGTGCSWNWWKGRPERWTGCFVLGLALAVPLFIEARHDMEAARLVRAA